MCKVVLVPTSNLRKTAELTLELLSDKNIPGELVDATLRLHANCFSWEGECELCEFLGEDEDYGQGYEYGSEYILLALAGNPSLNPQQQDQVLSAIFEYKVEGGMAGRFEVFKTIAANPNVADAIKSGWLLQASTYECLEESTPEDNLEYEREWVTEMLEIFKNNPRFSPGEIQKFKIDVQKLFDIEL